MKDYLKQCRIILEIKDPAKCWCSDSYSAAKLECLHQHIYLQRTLPQLLASLHQIQLSELCKPAQHPRFSGHIYSSHRLRYLLLFQLPPSPLDWNGWMEGRELNKLAPTNVTPLRGANFARLRRRWISLCTTNYRPSLLVRCTSIWAKSDSVFLTSVSAFNAIKLDRLA
jgi:hypothetical protein